MVVTDGNHHVIDKIEGRNRRTSDEFVYGDLYGHDSNVDQG